MKINLKKKNLILEFIKQYNSFRKIKTKNFYQKISMKKEQKPYNSNYLN